MLWIKRILLVIIGLIAILAISLFGFKYYRSLKSDEIKIPKNSYSVIRIKIDNLAIDLFKNSISNYSEYYSRKKDSTRVFNQKNILDLGVKIPADLYLFSLSDTSTTWYSILDISNEKNIDDFLKNKLDLKDSIFEESNTSQRIFVKKSLGAMLGNGKIIISFGPDPQFNLMKELIGSNQSDWILAKSMVAGISKISDSKVSYSDQMKNWAKVDFKKGRINMEAYIKSQLFKFPTTANEIEDQNNQVLSFAFNSDLSLLLKDRQDQLEKLKLSVDSVYKYVGNFVSIRLDDGYVMETDTIITYDYDDNFNMVEKKEIQKIEVPDLAFNIMASPHLVGYLPDKMFYKFSKEYKQGMINLFTGTKKDHDLNLKPSDYVLSMNYRKSTSTGKYLNWIPKFEALESGEVRGKAISENEINLTGEFILVDSELNSLYQLLVN